MTSLFKKLLARVCSKTVNRRNNNNNNCNETGKIDKNVQTSLKEENNSDYITVLLKDFNGHIRVVFQHGMENLSVQEGTSMQDVLKNMDTESVLKNLRPQIRESELKGTPVIKGRSSSLKKLFTDKPTKEITKDDTVLVDLFEEREIRSKSLSKNTTSPILIVKNRSQTFSRLQATKPPTEDEERLMECLNDYKIGLPLFIRYCQAEFSLENIEIWKDLELNYGKLNKPSMQNYLSILYDKFIDEKSVKEINIPSKTKNRFIELLNGNWMKDHYEGPMPQQVLFELKQDIKLNLLDTWSRFESTEMFRLYNGFVRYLRNSAMMS
jgi:hypothetical protein